MAGLYLVVNSDLRVSVALVEGFDLADVLLLRELHHPEHDRHLCWKLGELQLTTRRWGRTGGAKDGGMKKGEFAEGYQGKSSVKKVKKKF